MTDAHQHAKPPCPACPTHLDLQKREQRRLDMRIFHALSAVGSSAIRQHALDRFANS
jgi:hypothetical protein